MLPFKADRTNSIIVFWENPKEFNLLDFKQIGGKKIVYEVSKIDMTILLF